MSPPQRGISARLTLVLLSPCAGAPWLAALHTPPCTPWPQERDAQRQQTEQLARENAELQAKNLQFENKLRSIQQHKQEMDAEHHEFLKQFSQMSTTIQKEKMIVQEEKRGMQQHLQIVAAERDLLR